MFNLSFWTLKIDIVQRRLSFLMHKFSVDVSDYVAMSFGHSWCLVRFSYEMKQIPTMPISWVSWCW
jgi:hypothetical protein